MSTMVVVTGAGELDPAAVAAVPVGAAVIAADGGLDLALAAGLRPGVLVGDLDSVSPEGLAWAEEHAEVRRHPADKGSTDTELALAVAAERRPTRLIALAGGGVRVDRLDHLLGAVGALGGPLTAQIPSVEGWWGDQEVRVVRPAAAVWWSADPGATFSVLALHGPCRGVTITGARWPLAAADLDPMSGRGISNEVAAPPVSVTVADGVLTVIVPRTTNPQEATDETN